MPKAYPAHEKARLMREMVRSAEKRLCRSRSALERQFGVSRQTIYNWMAEDPRFGEDLAFALDGVQKGSAATVPDFEAFRLECFGHETFAHQREWFEALENYDRTLILVPPEHAKTMTMAIEYPVWRICQDPNIRIIIVCKNQEVAKKRLYAIKKRLNDSAWYRGNGWRNPIAEWGPFAPSQGEKSDLPWTQTLIYVRGVDSGEKDATVEVLGVGNQIQGARADLIVLDDIADLKNQMSESTVSGMLEWLGQEVTTRLSDEGKMIIIGTRVHEADIYAPLLSEDTDWARDFAKIVRPAIIDEETKTVLWPEHWSYEKLVSKRRSRMIGRNWSLTFQQEAIGMPGAPWSPETIDRMKDPSYRVGQVEKGVNVVCGVDPAMEGNCAITTLVVDRETKERWIIDCQVRSQFSNTDMLKNFIMDNVRTYGAQRCRIERNAMQGLLTKDIDLRRKLIAMGCQLEEEFTGPENKYDPQWGVLSVAAACEAGLYHLPWAYGSQERMQPLIDELLVWRAIPQSRARRKQDRVMSLWLAELSARQFTSYKPGMPTKRKTPLWVRSRSTPEWVRNAKATA